MGLLADLKGWIGLGNKAGDVVDTGLNLIKTGARGIDLLFHTDEEKSQEATAGRKAMLEHAITINKLVNESNTMSSRTRQVLAYVITGNVLLVFNFCISVLAWAYIFGESRVVAREGGLVETIPAIDKAQLFIRDVVVLVDKFYIGEAFAGVIGVFFLYYGIKKGLNARG